ncbi:MAG: hypothetical protein JWM11_7510 [Planctomycetaceae bacterium]|nr:hypothetical protein [Planctomycetaceae bacterium]
MSHSSNPNIPTRPQVRPWTQSERFCCGAVLLMAYVISPPWVMLFFRLIQAPQWVFNLLTLLYAPINSVRLGFPLLDTLYSGYRDLLQPWLFGA